MLYFNQGIALESKTNRLKQLSGRHSGYQWDLSSSGDLFISDGYGNARVHKFSPDGTLLLREMTGLDVAVGYDSLSIDSSLGVEVFPGEAEISLVDLCRLTNDKVNITWEESFKNICKLNFTKVTQ